MEQESLVPGIRFWLILALSRRLGGLVVRGRPCMYSGDNITCSKLLTADEAKMKTSRYLSIDN